MVSSFSYGSLRLVFSGIAAQKIATLYHLQVYQVLLHVFMAHLRNVFSLCENFLVK